MRNLVILGAFLLLGVPLQAAVITVDDDGPADFNNIQDAINYSWHGDTIVVKPGTYIEKIYFNGRAITVTSLDPNVESIRNATIIDGSPYFSSVIFDFGEDSNSVLTGFSIKGYPVECKGSSPTITKNRFFSNGYIISWDDASPTISYNTFYSDSFGISGCNGLIIHNLFSGCRIYQCDGVIANNIIKGCNINAVEKCNGTIINNTIVNNNDSGLFDCRAVVKNNIIAYNKCGIRFTCSNSYNNIWSNKTSNFSDGAAAGVGDISTDPLFVSSNDYHLKSHAGRWDIETSSWVIDDANSRCIDAGDPSDSVGVEPNPNCGRINMGAYGGTAEASKSPSGIVEPVCTRYPAMDFNTDCKVDFQDLAIFCESWLECNLDPPDVCWQ